MAEQNFSNAGRGTGVMDKSNIEFIHSKPVPRPGRWISAIIVFVIASMGVSAVVTNEKFDWYVVWQWLFSQRVMMGVMFTLILTVLAMVFGTILAVTMAIMRQSLNPVLRGVSWFYIWFFRGTPIYTQLIFWSLVPVLYPNLSLGIPFGPEFVTFETKLYFNTFWMAVVGLSLNEGAYLAEIIRSGLNSVDPGQREAAESLGMKPGQVMRRIILPQAMRVIIPPLGNETISMLKTTSLASVIPFILELTFVTNDKGTQLFKPIPLLLTAAIWYLIITSILMVVQIHLERYFGRGFGSSSKETGKKGRFGRKGNGPANNQQTKNLFLDVTP
ncbi:amino acid ABC transporter permease [Actinotignum urinale]